MDFNIVYVKALHSASGPKTQPGVPLVNQLAVAAHIAMRYVDWSSGDSAWPSIATLAKALGMSPKTTGNAITALEKQGWLIVELRRNRPSIYKLAIPKLTQPLHGDVDFTQQPLRSAVTVTAQNLLSDVDSTRQNLRSDVTLNASDVNFAASDVTVTDDPIVLPIKESLSKDLSDLPQQRKDTPGDDDDQTLKVGVESSTNQETTPAPTVLDGNERMRNHTERIMSLMSDYETAHKGVYLIAKGCGYEFDKRQCCSIHEALAHRTFTADEMRTYMTEKLAAIGHLPQHAAPGILTGNASEWLTDYRRKKRDEEEGVQYLETTWGRMRVIPETEEEKRIKREIREQEERDRAAWLALSPEERKAKEEEFALMALRLFDFDAPRNKNQDHTTTEAQDQGEADTWT